MLYRDGDKVSDQEIIVRRFKRKHLISPTEVNANAFKPRTRMDNQGNPILDEHGKEVIDEKVLSMDVRDLLKEDIGADWCVKETTNPLGTVLIKAEVPNSIEYPVLFGDPEAVEENPNHVNDSHCGIHECQNLLFDLAARKKMAAASHVEHVPDWDAFKKKKK